MTPLALTQHLDADKMRLVIDTGGPCPTGRGKASVTCWEDLVPREQSVTPSLLRALCAPLGWTPALRFPCGHPGREPGPSMWQLQGLQALGLCSCSAWSQGGRDVTLPDNAAGLGSLLLSSLSDTDLAAIFCLFFKTVLGIVQREGN